MSTREDFKAWADGKGFVLGEDYPGSYWNVSTATAWESWQAATSHQEAKIKALVEALEELDEEWRELNTAEFGMQGEETDAFYSLPSTLVALAAAKETP